MKKILLVATITAQLSAEIYSYGNNSAQAFKDQLDQETRMRNIENQQRQNTYQIQQQQQQYELDKMNKSTRDMNEARSREARTGYGR